MVFSPCKYQGTKTEYRWNPDADEDALIFRSAEPEVDRKSKSKAGSSKDGYLGVLHSRAHLPFLLNLNKKYGISEIIVTEILTIDVIATLSRFCTPLSLFV